MKNSAVVTLKVTKFSLKFYKVLWQNLKTQKENGKISYNVCIRIKGRKPLYATFDRLTDAKIWAGENESRLKLGKKSKILKLINIL